MSENININSDVSDEEIYKQLLPQIEAVINPDEPILSGLSNLSAILKDCFSKISWVGFYIVNGDSMYLGPFQGKLACVEIKIGNGVCGTSAKKKQTLVVEDVEKFPGHIACDAGSKSEIVVPIIVDNKIWGVLDLDSYEYSSFSDIDKNYLEKIIKVVLQKLNLSNFTIS